MVLSSHAVDWEFSCSGSFSRFDRTSSVWCLEWGPEVSHTIWWGFWSREEQNEYHSICSHSWWSSKVAWRLLQGIYQIAIFIDNNIDIRCLLPPPHYASCQLSATLVVVLMLHNSFPYKISRLRVVYFSSIYIGYWCLFNYCWITKKERRGIERIQFNVFESKVPTCISLQFLYSVYHDIYVLVIPIYIYIWYQSFRVWVMLMNYYFL